MHCSHTINSRTQKGKHAPLRDQGGDVGEVASHVGVLGGIRGSGDGLVQVQVALGQGESGQRGEAGIGACTDWQAPAAELGENSPDPVAARDQGL